MEAAASAEKKTPWGLIIFAGLVIFGAIVGYIYWNNRKFLNTPAVNAQTPKTKPNGSGQAQGATITG